MTDRPDHWDPKIERYCYAKLPAREVSAELRQRAQDMFAFVCADLRLHCPPQIVWICPAQPAAASAILGDRALDVWLEERHAAFSRLREDLDGGYTPAHTDLHEIWIRSDLTASPDLEYVVAHELRHVWQKLHVIKIFQKQCLAEGDAYPYGYDVLKRYLDARGELTRVLREKIDSQRAATEAWFRAKWPDARFKIVELTPGGGAGGS